MTQTSTLPALTISPAELKPGLYLIATPIGNLGDMSVRAIATIAALDVLYCEDTRVTRVLLQHFGLKTKLAVYEDHRAERVEAHILEALARGQKVGLCSDAGMPLISDPGYPLIKAASIHGHYITSVPGANAVLTALQLSALPTDRFTFHGFLPPKAQARAERLHYLKDIPITQVFYETGPRIADALTDMLSAFGDRPAALARELTKKFETVLRGTLSSIIADITATPPKGELVLVVGGAEVEATTLGPDTDALLKALLPTHGTRATADLVAAATKLPRKELYDRLLELKADLPDKNG